MEKSLEQLKQEYEKTTDHNRPEALFTFVLAFPAQFVVSDTAAVI